MTRADTISFCTWALSLALGVLVLAPRSAQTQPSSPSSPADPVQHRKPPVPPPMPPLPVSMIPSPVDYFRKLLAMSPEQREQQLATKTPEQRAVVERKLQEFLGLSMENRESRLTALHVRFLVRQLIRVPYSNRVDRLNTLPLVDRQMVQSILRDWEGLSPEQQTDVLENEWAIRVSARNQQTSMVTNAPLPAHQAELEQRLAGWRNMPYPKRQQVLDHFSRFFEELTDAERFKALHVLPDAERAQIEAALLQFSKLSPEQRDRCLTNFQKFADLSPVERQQFLENVSVWQSMSPKDRANWRRLVLQMSLQPPLPPEPSSRMLLNSARTGAAVRPGP